MGVLIRYIKEVILSKLKEEDKEFERLLYEMDFQNFERLLQVKLHDVGRTIIKRRDNGKPKTGNYTSLELHSKQLGRDKNIQLQRSKMQC